VRVPAIEAARKYLGWAPTTDLRSAVRKTIAYYVSHGIGSLPELTRPLRQAS
jgi:nucleoside-diphosphate-sugar epimerase